jgi:hypothetical protein
MWLIGKPFQDIWNILEIILGSVKSRALRSIRSSYLS